jgi:hypothetical protein
MPDNIGQKQNINEVGIGEDRKTTGGEVVITEQDIVIHAMPKRFLVSGLTSKKDKGIGLLILTAGAIILILGGIFLYLYISKSGSPFFNNSNIITDNSLKTDKTSDTASSSQIKETNKPEDTALLSAASSSPENDSGLMGAPTTTLIATSAPEEVNGQAPADLASSTKTIKAYDSASAVMDYAYPNDTDKDGLFDVEELLFNSNINMKDSDADSFTDLAEMLGLYNPAGTGGIIVNQNIEKYINNKYGYSLYYPYVWQAEKINGDDSIIFKLGNNQFIQIITEQNIRKQSLNDWYKENSDNAVINSSQMLYKKGWEGIKSKNGLTVFLTKPDLNVIIVMSYSLGTSNIANYKNVFDMTVNSLEIGN